MRKSVWIFLLAVLIPSAVLGWLALRSAEEQKIILERQTTELYQRETESLAAAARAVIDEQRRDFAEAVRALLSQASAADLAPDFTAKLPGVWSRRAVGFSLAGDGRVLSPTTRLAASRAEWGAFLREQSLFLGNASTAAVYNVPVDALTQPEQLRKLKASAAIESPAAQAPAPVAVRAPAGGKALAKDESRSLLDLAPAKPAPALKSADSSTARQRFAPPPAPAPMEKAEAPKRNEAKTRAEFTPTPTTTAAPVPTAPAPAAPRAGKEADTATKQARAAEAEKRDAQHAQNAISRVVQPQQLAEVERTAVSNVLPENVEFRTLTAGQNEGILARFVQDKLTLIFWLRPPQASEMIFGCVIEAADLADLWPQVMPATRDAPQFVLALLDDRARPVATAPAGGPQRDWKRPFVASEIGEALPHWEAALYLMRPEQLAESALGLRRTLLFLIAAMLGAIALGGWLVVADARRQLALAQQKTDFVSNVSHELKTPLTSIRMFAELMLGGRADGEKAPQYLRIIMVEAERLTRLINNVLDFAKLERRQKRFDKKPLDLHGVIARVWEGQELHLRESSFTTKWEAAPPPYSVLGDEDALAQILVNLLSNAEKYSGERKQIELHSYFEDHHICVSVLDRGLGVPGGSERKIFDAFYRAHDSLSSGIQGSGLGLTLALRLAAEHGGAIEYRPREGGGSAFTFKLPLAPE